VPYSLAWSHSRGYFSIRKCSNRAVLDGSASNPHWFQGGSGSSFLSRCGSRCESGSRELYTCLRNYFLRFLMILICFWTLLVSNVSVTIFTIVSWGVSDNCCFYLGARKWSWEVSSVPAGVPPGNLRFYFLQKLYLLMDGTHIMCVTVPSLDNLLLIRNPVNSSLVSKWLLKYLCNCFENLGFIEIFLLFIF
jgi:hypothetical protein